MGPLKNVCRLRSSRRAILFVCLVVFSLYTLENHICDFINLTPCCSKDPIRMAPNSTSKSVRNSVVKETRFILNAANFHKPETWLVIGVISGVGNFRERKAVRSTWGSVIRDRPDSSIVLVFVLGIGDVSNITLQQKLKKENAEYGDIVQVNVKERYENLVLKGIGLLKWATEYCGGFKHLLKVDDDVFINMNRLIRLIEMYQSEPKFIMGQVIRNTKPNRRKNSKHYVSLTDFPETSYPTYVTGTAYVISGSMVREILTVIGITPLVRVEDLYITGICARRVGGVFIGDCGFSYQSIPLEHAVKSPDRVTFHGLTVNQFTTLWKILNFVNT